MKITGHRLSAVTLHGLFILFVTALTAVSGGVNLQASSEPPETTGTAPMPSVQHAKEALAIPDGKIIFVGADADAAKLVGPKTQVERAGGKRVLPGLIDAHIHPMGIVDFGDCDL